MDRRLKRCWRHILGQLSAWNETCPERTFLHPYVIITLNRIVSFAGPCCLIAWTAQRIDANIMYTITILRRIAAVLYFHLDLAFFDVGSSLMKSNWLTPEVYYPWKIGNMLRPWMPSYTWIENEHRIAGIEYKFPTWMIELKYWMPWRPNDGSSSDDVSTT